MADEIGHPVGRQRQLEGELEEEHRADGQVRPGEELVLAGPRAPTGEARSSTTWAAISPKSTRIKTSTVFSRIATNRRPKSVCIRRASSFSCHAARTCRARAVRPGAPGGAAARRPVLILVVVGHSMARERSVASGWPSAREAVAAGRVELAPLDLARPAPA